MVREVTVKERFLSVFSARDRAMVYVTAAVLIFVALSLIFFSPDRLAPSSEEPQVVVSAISVESPDYVAILKERRDHVPIVVLRKVSHGEGDQV